MITLTFACGGCDKKELGTGFLRREFQPRITGVNGSFGVYREPQVEDVLPEGWIAFDPYTQCTYCPECWESIIHGIAKGRAG